LDAARPWFDLAWDIHLVGIAGRPDPKPEAVPPHQRAKLEADLEALMQRVGHEGLRRHLRGHVRERLNALFQPARSRPFVPRAAFQGRPAAPQAPGLPPPNPLGARKAGVSERRERELVAAVLNHPALVERIDEELASLHLKTPRLDDMCRKILEVAAAAPGLDSPALQRHLRECGFSDVLDALFAPRPWSERVSLGSYVMPGASLVEAERGWRATYELHQGALLAEEEAAARQSMAENPTPESWEVHKALIALNLARKPAVGGEGGQA
jgi:DNA primase